MCRIVKTIDKYINSIVGFFAIVMLIAMSVIVFAQVVFRLAHASIPWSEEVSKNLLVWTTFLGAALCVRKGSLIGLEILYMILPSIHKKKLIVVINILSALFMMYLIVVGYRTSIIVWTQTTPVLKMSMGIMYAAVPVGALFMLINCFIITYYQIVGEKVN